MGLSRHKLLLVAVSLLFLLSSGSSLYLQHRQEQLVDTFYRNIHWNISQVMLESQRFLYDLQLYRAGRLGMETLSLDYDLLWNRLDIFLISSETAEARQRHGLGKALAGLFEQIKQLEPQMEAGALREGAELARLQEAIASQTHLIEQIGDQILSGQERERSVSQIRSSLFWLQIWQLILLLTGGALVAALIRANLANRRLALLDPLTRLGNRRALQEQLSRALHAGEASALVVLDLKRFKQVNDLLGYQVGDRLLQTVADKLQQAHGSHAYRLGGDEFAVVLTSADGALETRIHELVSLLHFEFVTRECSFDLACRLGVAKAQQQDAGRLLDQAILALNQAKRSQEGDICWFEPAMLQQLQLSQHQLHQLRDWLAGREPAPLRVALQGLTDGQGNDMWQMTLYWREQGRPVPCAGCRSAACWGPCWPGCCKRTRRSMPMGGRCCSRSTTRPSWPMSWPICRMHHARRGCCWCRRCSRMQPCWRDCGSKVAPWRSETLAAPPRPSWRPAGLSVTGCQMTRSTVSCCSRWPGDWGWCSCRCWRAVRQGSWPEHKERY
ncbi:GGDEF domain-containing protein [Aeromonas hydrophila]|nr:GGDEF domain-containing protein [Aeromonas hydrophila]